MTLFEKAIADAKQVRQIGIENAKLAMQEKLMPKIDKWLSESVDGDDDEYLDEFDDPTPDSAIIDEEEFEDDEFLGEMDDEFLEEEDDEFLEEEDDAYLDEEDDDFLEEYNDAIDTLDEEDEMDDEFSDDDDDIVEALRYRRTNPRRRKVGSVTERKLAKAMRTIKTMRKSMNETTLLNTKVVLYKRLTNRYAMNENQIRTFLGALDRATTVREAKLVYASAASSFQSNAKSKNKTRRKSSGFASKATAPRRLKESVDTTPGNVEQKRLLVLAGLRKPYN